MFAAQAHAGHAAAHHLCGHAAFAHLLEHLGHLGVLAEEVVDVLNLGAGAFGDALAAAAVDDLVVAALLVGHGVDDGFEARELLFVDVPGGLLHAGEGADGGEHLEDAFHGAHFLDLTELVAEVFEREAVAEEGFLGELFGLFAVEGGLGVFDEGHDVAHAEDAADDAVGVEGLEGVGLFAGAEELDGLAGDVADGEGRAAAGVAVHLGEDDAGEAEALVEGWAELTASWPVMASATKRISVGLSSFLSAAISSMRSSSMCEAAGGVDDEDVAADVDGFAAGFFGEALDERRCRRARRSWLPS